MNFNYDILEAELGEITRATELAENDSQIEMIILDLEGLGNISPAQGDRIIEALLQFKNSEKKIASYATAICRATIMYPVLPTALFESHGQPRDRWFWRK